MATMMMPVSPLRLYELDKVARSCTGLAFARPLFELPTYATISFWVPLAKHKLSISPCFLQGYTLASFVSSLTVWCLESNILPR
jgi:hypothetical protein